MYFFGNWSTKFMCRQWCLSFIQLGPSLLPSSAIVSNKAQKSRYSSFFQLSNLSLGLFQRQYVVEESQNWRRSNLSYQENKEWSFYCSLHWQWPAWWEELRVTLSKNLTRSLKKDDQAHSFIHLSQDFLFFQASIRSAAEVDAFGSFWYGPNQLFFCPTRALTIWAAIARRLPRKESKKRSLKGSNDK